MEFLMNPVLSTIAVLTAAAFPVLAHSADGEPKTPVKTYIVSGSSAAELNRSLRANGPGQAVGRANYDWKYSFSYKRRNGKFAITDVKVSQSVHILMPEWKGYDKASRCLRQSWDRFYKNLLKHEQTHVRIGADVAGRIRKALRGIGPAESEAALKDAVRKAAGKIITEAEKANRRFDRRTDHGRRDENHPVVLKSCS